MSTKNSILAGAAGGVAGGLAMAMGLAAAKKMGMIKTPLPVKIEHEVERRAGFAEQTDRSQELGLAMIEHMLLSTGIGIPFGLLLSRLRFPVWLSGMGYGLAVYAINLAGFGPTLDLTRGPWDEKTSTVAKRMMMHIVYGLATGLVADKVQEELTDG